MKNINICFFTGSRSEFGISKILIEKFKKTKFNFSLVASGSHLMRDFGETIDEIKDLKIQNLDKIRLKNYKKLLHHNIHANSFAKNCVYLKKKKFDYALIIGDRIESLSFALSCFFFKIKIIHFHGGELTQGSLDNYYRNIISSISNYHFVSNFIYKKRLINLGNEPKKIFNIGSLSLDKISNYKFVTKKEFQLKNKILFKNKIAMVSFHPLQEKRETYHQINLLTQVCKKFNDVSFIFTSPSMDPNYKIITNKIKRECKNNENFFYFDSLGHYNYVSVVKFCDLIIGNSSSGIIEAPFLKTLSINIGDRQLGREKSSSVINILIPDKNNLYKKMEKLLYRKQKIKFQNKYFKKNASQHVMKIFKNIILKDKSEKIFYDIKN